jgi:S-formylglutathione hydrolase FrmB
MATPPRPIAAGHVELISVPSPEQDRPVRQVWVYRPAVPDSAQLPVLYFLHGFPGTAGDVFAAGFAQFLDNAFAGGADPFVVASPDGSGDAHPDTEWADSSDGTDMLESFVAGNLINAVEGPYRRGPAKRAIAGFSMGGYGSMNIALRHRDLYGQVASLAGYFGVDDPDAVFGGDPGIEAANRPDEHISDAANLSILLIDGSEDNEPVVKGESQRFKALLDQAGLPATLIVDPGTHSWSLVSSEFGHLVAFLEAGFAR